MKGLILSGGKGTRLRPLTYTGAKQLVPVANKPVLFYAIEDLVEAGITDIGIICGDTADQIRAAVGDGSRFGATVTYIQQDAPRGIAHGVKIAQDFVGTDKFVLFLGDNFIREGIVGLVERFHDDRLNSIIVVTQVPNPDQFGVAVMDGERVVRVVEKPKDRISDLAVTGIYMFDHHVFEAVDNITPSARGELEITDTIQYLIDSGRTVLPHRLHGSWIDTGKMEDILEANRIVLEDLEDRIEGTVSGTSRLIGHVTLEPGAQVIDSIIRGPAIIGERTVIRNSYVGPFTSIYHDCVIENIEIEHSVVLERCSIQDLSQRIDASLIGRDVRISRAPERPRAHRFVLGDFSRLELP